MTRHRAPRGAQDQHARGRHGSAADTVPFAVPAGTARGRSRHRSPGRSALRRGALTAGIAGGALAVGGIAVPMLSAAGPDTAPTADLALSARSAPAGPVAAVTPATGRAEAVGAASSDLIKAVDRQRRAATDRAEARGRADRAAAEKAEEKRRTSSVSCGVSNTYDGVADSVQTVGNALECLFPGRTIYGTGSRGNASDHPGGYALDIMNKGGKASGEALASCVVNNADALGVKYTIFNRRIDTGSGWEGMEDRGGVTANHEDHVHISFERGASPNVQALRSCGGAASDAGSGAGKA